MEHELLIKLRAAIANVGAPSSDFDLNPEVRLPEGRKLRSAGVLMPIIQRGGGLNVILTKRSSALKHHPGQIAFPGGKQDTIDVDITATALREADEEIGLPARNVSVIGHLPQHETVTGFQITPVIGLLKSDFTPTPEPGEVEEVFEVPLSLLADPTKYSIQYRHWRGQKRLFQTVPYGPYYIWGATARILYGLANRMAH